MRFLGNLNAVSNAFKHSFINSDINLMGADYPVVYALGLSRNNLENSPEFYALAFGDIIQDFDALYAQTMPQIREWGVAATLSRC